MQRGHLAEVLVAERLAARGWTIHARNWRGGGGELDVVAGHDGKLRFVEVKVRDPADILGDDAVSPHKRRRLKSAAEAWLAGMAGEPVEACFLVAYVDATVDPWAIRWIDDAF
ncbi:MAG: YraN family protein [Pseudomonadota bacterium]|nr:YraN family protein [Pseudomonadota bacterium]